MSDSRNIIGTWELLVVFWRALLIQASWSYDRMQTIGFVYAIEPALRKLYPDREEYEARLRFHLDYFNTQPYFASFILGATLRLERDRAGGQGTTDGDIAAVKTSLMAPLGALGDSFFWGALKPLAAVSAAAVFVTGSWWAPILFFALFNFWHLWLRIGMLFRGFRSGGDAVALLSRYRFTRMAKRFKLVSLSVLGGLLGLAPHWRQELRLPIESSRLALLFSALAVTLILISATRKGGSPVKLMIGLAALCLILAYAGVV